MAQTTGAQSGTGMKITLDAVDVSGSANKVSIKPTKAIGKTHTFLGNGPITVAGKEDWNGTVRAVYTETSGEAWHRLYTAWKAGALVALIVTPKGGSTGDWTFSGNVRLKDFPLDTEATSPGPMMAEWSFEGDGEITKSTHA